MVGKIETKSCKCVMTGETINCGQCMNPYTDRDINRRSCNMIPLKATKIECACKNTLIFPAHLSFMSCKKCERKYVKNRQGRFVIKSNYARHKKVAEAVKEAEQIHCDCGNKIVISKHSVDRKCFECNSFWVKNKDGNWTKQDKITKTPTTLNASGDINDLLAGKKITLG